jgi:TonB family protein
MPAPRTQRKKSATRLSLIISLVFHVVVIGLLAYFAAREGLLGKQLKTIAVSLAPKEKPPEPEKPVEPEKPPVVEPSPNNEPPPELPPVIAPPPPQVANTPPPTAVAPPAAAPPAVGLPSFAFSDGAKAVESTSDPVDLYRRFVEFTLRSKWLRPERVADDAFVAEVEIQVDPAGTVTASTWRKGSGHVAWDASVRQALAQTRSIGRPPPKGFPDRFLVRFDVATETDANSLAVP